MSFSPLGSLYLFVPLLTSLILFGLLWTSFGLFWPLFTSFHLFSSLSISFYLFSPLFSALLHNREDSAERDLARVGIADPLPHAVQLVEYGSNHYNFARSAYIYLLLLYRKQRRGLTRRWHV